MTPCSDVVGYQRFEGPCCLHLQGEVNSVHILTPYFFKTQFNIILSAYSFRFNHLLIFCEVQTYYLQYLVSE